MNALTTAVIAAAASTAMMITYDVIKGYVGQPPKVTAEATSTPYLALVPENDHSAPSFTRDVASLRFPAQFDKDLQQRLIMRAAMFDSAATTARAECLHRVTVTNNTPKPVKSLTVTADVLVGYGYPGGAVTAGDEPAPVIEKLIPGASVTLLLFSALSCDLGSYHNIRVFNDDDSADVDVTGPLPLFVVVLAQNWGWVLVGIIAFIVIGSISDAAKHSETKRLKEELAKYKPPAAGTNPTTSEPVATTETSS